PYTRPGNLQIFLRAAGGAGCILTLLLRWSRGDNPHPLRLQPCTQVINMNQDSEREPTLSEIEEEVLAEGREWMRQRLQQKLQARADRISQNFSPQGRPSGPMSKKKADSEKQRRSGPG